MDLFSHTDSPGNTESVIHLELVVGLTTRPGEAVLSRLLCSFLPVSVPMLNSGTDGLLINLISILDTDSGYELYDLSHQY